MSFQKKNRARPEGNFFRCLRARANLHALMTPKSCAEGMCNAILRNTLIGDYIRDGCPLHKQY